MTVRLRVGMGDSYGLRETVVSGPDFDPSAVTGGTFHITKPTAVSGVTTTTTWVGSLGTQNASSVELLYAFNASGLDLDFAGTWRAWIQWTVPGESPGPRTEVASFAVVAADAL